MALRFVSLDPDATPADIAQAIGHLRVEQRRQARHMHRYQELGEEIDELVDLYLVTQLELRDSGFRTSLDDAITAFGFNRGELEAELDADDRD